MTFEAPKPVVIAVTGIEPLESYTPFAFFRRALDAFHESGMDAYPHGYDGECPSFGYMLAFEDNPVYERIPVRLTELDLIVEVYFSWEYPLKIDMYVLFTNRHDQLKALADTLGVTYTTKYVDHSESGGFCGELPVINFWGLYSREHPDKIVLVFTDNGNGIENEALPEWYQQGIASQQSL